MGEPVSVFYHYTTLENFENIRRTRVIEPALRNSQNRPIVNGIDLRRTPAIFFTRMDPSNPKESIAFNNYR